MYQSILVVGAYCRAKSGFGFCKAVIAATTYQTEVQVSPPFIPSPKTGFHPPPPLLIPLFSSSPVITRTKFELGPMFARTTTSMSSSP